MERQINGILTDIQRFSVHDGPGIRTVMFFKGCPLRCKWCQNPETQKLADRILYNPALCIGCGACIRACPKHAIDPETGEYDRSRCTACGSCVETCYAGARTIPGAKWTLADARKAALADQIFYRKSGGGVTLSGGEVTMQPEFALALLEALQIEGVHTAIETCGACSLQTMLRFLPLTDLFLYDVKLMDPARHRSYTGGDNEQILQNLRELGARRANLIIRVPLIPGVNDSEENLRQTGLLAREVGAWELHLLPFHQLGEGKWDNLGMPYECRSCQPPSEAQLESAKQQIEALGVPVNIGGLGIYSGRGDKTHDKS